MPATVGDAAAAAGILVVRTYGMSETAGGCVYDGVPLDGVQVRVDDGRVVLGGATLAKGYRHPTDPRSVRRARLVPHRWTLASLTIRGRCASWDASTTPSAPAADVLPQLVEAALATHLAIADCAVSGDRRSARPAGRRRGGAGSHRCVADGGRVARSRRANP